MAKEDVGAEVPLPAALWLHETGLSRYKEMIDKARIEMDMRAEKDETGDSNNDYEQKRADADHHHAVNAMLVMAQANRVASVLVSSLEIEGDEVTGAVAEKDEYSAMDVDGKKLGRKDLKRENATSRLMARLYLNKIVADAITRDNKEMLTKRKTHLSMTEEVLQLAGLGTSSLPTQPRRLTAPQYGDMLHNVDMESNIELLFKEYPEFFKSDADLCADDSGDDDNAGGSENSYKPGSESGTESETNSEDEKRRAMTAKRTKTISLENSEVDKPKRTDVIAIDDDDDDDNATDAVGILKQNERSKAPINPYAASSRKRQDLNVPSYPYIEKEVRKTNGEQKSAKSASRPDGNNGNVNVNPYASSTSTAAFKYSLTPSDSSQNNRPNNDNSAAWDDYNRELRAAQHSIIGSYQRNDSTINECRAENRSSWNNRGNYYTASDPASALATNPFQTAREFAMNGGDECGEPRNNTYNYRAPPNESTHQQNEPPPSGLSIPESLRRKFQPPKRLQQQNQQQQQQNTCATGKPSSGNNSTGSGNTSYPSLNQGKGGVSIKVKKGGKSKSGSNCDDDDELPEELQHLDKELVKKIQHEIMESGDQITFDDIAGLDDAKQTVQEVVCWPMKRPDLFVGLRQAPNGLLLFGPPGTGKTLIGKAIAYESGATFFSISSSSLTSKWIGEGEKLVRTLFAVAAYRQPAVVFIDEIDSLLTQRKSTENEASRRIKTEFLVQLDGTGTTGQGRVLVIGATNRPQELDEAARRRFVKRLYIPLPNEKDREMLFSVLLGKASNNHTLTVEQMRKLARNTASFSGADLKALCTDAAMGPIRELGATALEVDVRDVPAISYKHFRKSLRGVRPSVAESDLEQYVVWDNLYGSKRASAEETGSVDDDDDDDGDLSDDE